MPIADKTGVILLVYSYPEQQDLLSRMLGNQEFTLVTAASAEAALDAVRLHSPNLIISDFDLPDFSASRLCQRLKSDPATTDIPFLLFATQRCDNACVIEALDAGADDYLASATPPDLIRRKAESLIALFNERRSYKQVEAALNDSQVIFTLDLDGKLKSINKAGESITGYEVEDLLNKNIFKIVALEDINLMHQILDSKSTEYERLVDRLAGLAQAFGTARDLITIYRALCDFTLASVPCSAILISLYDVARECRYATHFWYNNKEIDVSGIDPIPVANGPAGKAIKTGKVMVCNEYLKSFEGITNPYSLGFDEDPRSPQSSVIAPIVVMGRTIGTVEVQSYDADAYNHEHITALRLAANLTAVAIENVRLLDRENANAQQLRQAQKMEAVGRLAGGVAHDFNNLLTVINGYSDTLMMRLNQADPMRADLQEIRKAGDRAASLTRQLLAFSRKQMLQPRVLDLNLVVGEMDKMLRRLIREDIELVIILRAEIGRIKADPSQIELVIINLAVNARDAMPEGGQLIIETSNVNITEGVMTPADAIPGSYVMLSISDTGRGMDSEILSHVFEPFFTTKEKGKGTGLGLSSVYGIVKQSGGFICAESEPGRGARFKIYLPQVEGELDAVATTAKPGGLLRGSETLLLVEDEDIVRKLAYQVLTMHGYKVIEAQHGAEALSICEQYKGQIDAMVTDLVMPHMNGRQLAERVAMLHPQMKVLYMSGYASGASLFTKSIPQNAFLQKPFAPDNLAFKLRQLLDEQRDLPA